MGTAATPSYANNPFARQISQIDTFSIDELVGETRLGPSNSFRDAKELFERIKALADDLRYADLAGVPEGTAGRVVQQFQEVVKTFQQIKALIPSNLGNYEVTRANYIQSIRNNYQGLFEASIPLLLYSSLRSSGIKNAESRAAELLATAEKQNNEQIAIVSAAKDLLANHKKFAQEIAVTGYGTLFAREARRHDIGARIWLGVAGVLAGGVAIIGWMNYSNTVRMIDKFSNAFASGAIQPSIPSSLTIQFAMAKVILFTIGLSAAYWSARVYRSHRHNSVVNRHRANALTSFETFVGSTTDQEVKNAVLLQTTACIYAPQATGFTSSTDADGESPLKVLEIVRNFQK
jgi:hypothetical protein